MERYFGKYRAFVLGNDDPAGLGRIQVEVPTLSNAHSMWALWAPDYGRRPLSPAAPPRGTQVLIEFLEGDLAQPVWCGHFVPGISDIATPGDEAVPVVAGADGTVRIAAGQGAIELGVEGVTFSFGDSRITLTQGAITLRALAISLDGHDIALGEGAYAPLVNGPALLSAFSTHLHDVLPSHGAAGAVAGPPVPPLTPNIYLTKVRGA